ncbi:DUF2254 domain-containing protein [Salinimonas sp. HHU 13199]|uniref:DUF2254 domain-containing protein n=1 Tax=Salinimonas profundi TaxID=2729140 RepID=A0ABR8LFX6_9ALTE|nr:DUF2254 domain-containing protein [Salinimonas profundi]MBD3584632.1 DUF2254 domain-containing protein [Salinimonas profundi]
MANKNAFPELTVRFRTWWEGVSTSYWFIPVCMMLTSFLLCYLCLTYIERTKLPDNLQSLVPMVTQNGAQQILSTIASSIITATSIAFSMTVVALTLASSQFGPRLLRTFMLDRGTQYVLGLLVSSFTFCLISLHHLSSMVENDDALAILSGISVVVGILDIFAIIFFIHHIGRFIQADEVIFRCYDELMQNIDELLPKPEDAPRERALPEALISDSHFQIAIKIDKSGYVQSVNYEKLLTSDYEGLEGIEVRARSGDHVFPDASVLIIHSRYRKPPEHYQDLLDLIILGHRRTPVQDPEFAISQMVELALRALSPGINDPITAISCLDRLTASCIYMSKRTFPAQCVMNKETGVWLKRRTFSIEGVINTAFDQIRQAGKDHVDIALHILFCLKTLTAHLPDYLHPLLKLQAESTYQLILDNPLSEQDKKTINNAFIFFR